MVAYSVHCSEPSYFPFGYIVEIYPSQHVLALSQSSMEGHLGCFQPFAITKVHFHLWECIYGINITKSTAGSNNICTFSFSDYCQIALQEIMLI